MDRLTPEMRSLNMSRIRGANTAPELAVRSILQRLGYRFRLHVNGLPGRPDIVLPRYRTVVFVHGCFWHRHRGCRYTTTPKTRAEFWAAKFDGNVARDRRARARLRSLGWKAMTVWECEIRNEERLAARLHGALQGETMALTRRARRSDG